MRSSQIIVEIHTFLYVSLKKPTHFFSPIELTHPPAALHPPPAPLSLFKPAAVLFFTFLHQIHLMLTHTSYSSSYSHWHRLDLCRGYVALIWEFEKINTIVDIPSSRAKPI